MKFKELPTMDVLVKLSKVAFPTAKKNVAVWNFTRVVTENMRCFYSNVEKLREGDADADDATSKKKIEALLDEEIPIKLPTLDIFMDDFVSSKFPADDESWLSSSEMFGIHSFSTKQKEGL